MTNNIQIQFSGDFIIMVVPLAINPYAIGSYIHTHHKTIIKINGNYDGSI